MAKKMLVPQVIAPNAFDRERVPEGFEAPPKVAVVLPGAAYSQLIAEQTSRSFEYHLLMNFDYSLFSPFEFDADMFVEEAIAYCRANDVQGVVAMDCFPTLLASVVREELGLPGPSFRSVVPCCNKYYMRRQLTPAFLPCEHGRPPPVYPAVVKCSDSQFYSHVRIVQDEVEWREAWNDLSAVVDLGRVLRQQFYHKWSKRFGFELEPSWEDIKLIHTEPYIKSQREFHYEIVFTADGLLTADTGDIVHMEGGDIMMFKTPTNVAATPVFLSWLRDINYKLVALGYRSAAIDVEVMRVDCDEERYELCEINSRYSHMGDWRVVEPADPTDKRAEFATATLTCLMGSSGSHDLQAFDVDGDGRVSREELEATLRRLGLQCKSDDTDAVFAALDADGSGMVELQEFRGALRQAVAAADRAQKSRPTEEAREVRNLLNRTRMALGAEPRTLPCRDQPGVSELAVALFTDRLGRIDDILDQRALDAYLEEGTFDAWRPKPTVASGVVTEADLVFGGWARLGLLLMTWEDNLDQINCRLDVTIRDLFVHKDRGWLPVQLHPERPVPPQLKPRFDMLQKGKKARCCVIS